MSNLLIIGIILGILAFVALAIGVFITISDLRKRHTSERATQDKYLKRYREHTHESVG